MFRSVVAKLSVARCNENIARGTGGKVFLQPQVDIVSVVEDEEPVPISLARKPPQTRIHALLCFSRDNVLKIRLNGLLICSVNVEDIGETRKMSLVNNRLILSNQSIYRLPFDSSINLNASWLFPAPPRPCSTKIRCDALSASKYVRILSRMSFRPRKEATGGGQSLRSGMSSIDSGGLGETGATMRKFPDYKDVISCIPSCSIVSRAFGTVIILPKSVSFSSTSFLLKYCAV